MSFLAKLGGSQPDIKSNDQAGLESRRTYLSVNMALG